MRGLGSRLAVFALALVVGAAGVRSSGLQPTAGMAECSAAPVGLATEVAAAGLGIGTTAPGEWARKQSERSGSTGSDTGPDLRRKAGPRPSCLPRHAFVASREPKLPGRGFGGLLGLATSSPANAPPGS